MEPRGQCRKQRGVRVGGRACVLAAAWRVRGKQSSLAAEQGGWSRALGGTDFGEPPADLEDRSLRDIQGLPGTRRDLCEHLGTSPADLRGPPGPHGPPRTLRGGRRPPENIQALQGSSGATSAELPRSLGTSGDLRRPRGTSGDLTSSEPPSHLQELQGRSLVFCDSLRSSEAKRRWTGTTHTRAFSHIPPCTFAEARARRRSQSQGVLGVFCPFSQSSLACPGQCR